MYLTIYTYGSKFSMLGNRVNHNYKKGLSYESQRGFQERSSPWRYCKTCLCCFPGLGFQHTSRTLPDRRADGWEAACVVCLSVNRMVAGELCVPRPLFGVSPVGLPSVPAGCVKCVESFMPSTVGPHCFIWFNCKSI